jgi:hypothetical protein
MIPLKKQLEDWNWKTSKTTNSPLKSKETMKYDITKHTAPTMPTLGKGTECIKILLSQASKDMHEPLVPMLFPPLRAHMSGAEFQYPDLTWKEPCGQMANLVAKSGGNKGQLSLLVEAERTTCHSSPRPKGTLGSISVAEPSVATSVRTTPDGTAVTASLILEAPYPPLTPASPPPYPLRARHGEARRNYGEDREKIGRKWKSLKLKSEN